VCGDGSLVHISKAGSTLLVVTEHEHEHNDCSQVHAADRCGAQ
jgi:hypothetical protein